MDKFDKAFNVRRKVLNMSREMWDFFHALSEGDETIITTPRAFLNKVGLAGGFSGKFNDDEREFFDLLYDLSRSTPTD